VKRISFLLFFCAVFLFAPLASGRIGGGDILFMPPKAKPVTFSHDFHVKDLELACQKCHPVPYVTAEKSKPLTMAAMAKGKSCGVCHDGKGAFSVNKKDDCSRCHQ
jgi:c(7)-type cytochrome triheme protein